MSNVAKDLAKLIAQSTEKKVGPYDTKAVVKRVEGNTVWVAIPGGVDETPISRTIDCAKGDTVQVRVSGGTAWITGNVTDPPTSNKKAEQALSKATKAAKSAERGLTSDTIYYLASDQDSGVTVDTPGWTEEPQEITEALPYLWIYHLYTYADGRTETTEPCIVGVYGPQGDQGDPGDPGDPGAPGVSVTKVEPQYYLSTSSSSATGGSWSNSLPTYVSGRYYWTRDKITYSNGTTGYSTATYSPGLTQSVKLSYDTAQHFWIQENGTTAVPNGVYVTDADPTTYKSSQTGGAAYINSGGMDILADGVTYSSFDGNGLKIYDGEGTGDTNTVARYTGGEAIIGYQDGAHAEISSSHFSIVAESGANAINVNTDSTTQRKQFATVEVTSSTYRSVINAVDTDDVFYAEYEVLIKRTSPSRIYTRTGRCKFVKGTDSTANVVLLKINNAIVAQLTAIYTASTSTLTTSVATVSGYSTQGSTIKNIIYPVMLDATIVDMSDSSVTALEVTVAGHSTPIGYDTGTNTGTASPGTGQWRTVDAAVLTRLQLDPGVWIIHAHAGFNSSSAGNSRGLRIYNTTTSAAVTRSTIRVPPVTGDATSLSTSAILTLVGENTYTVQLFQDTGNTLSTSVTIEAVRIA